MHPPEPRSALAFPSRSVTCISSFRIASSSSKAFQPRLVWIAPREQSPSFGVLAQSFEAASSKPEVAANVARQLERACELREGPLVYLEVYPTYDPLRSNLRFQTLVKRVGFCPGQEATKPATGAEPSRPSP